jgi:putative oxidoreductase
VTAGKEHDLTAITTSTLGWGLLVLRIVAGLTISAHGAQKLLGWFEGSGFAGTVKMQERMGLRPAWLWACLVILGELGGGLSVALGFLTPLGAAGMVGAMFMAIVKAHWKNGFFNGKRGLEFPLQLLAAALTIGLIGPGPFSLDALLSIRLPYPLLFVLLVLAALIVDGVGIFMSRGTHPSAPAPVSTGPTVSN